MSLPDPCRQLTQQKSDLLPLHFLQHLKHLGSCGHGNGSSSRQEHLVEHLQVCGLRSKRGPAIISDESPCRPGRSPSVAEASAPQPLSAAAGQQ